jgi:hypothetical protein
MEGASKTGDRLPFGITDRLQKRDHSALVAVERIDHRRALRGTAFGKLLVRYVERLSPGLPFPKIVERVREVVHSDELLAFAF